MPDPRNLTHLIVKDPEPEYSYEDIKAKLEWEGIDDGIEWFKPHEVPRDLREIWAKALDLKYKFDDALAEIEEILEDH